MSFVRPEVAALARRHRMTILFGLLTALGLWGLLGAVLRGQEVWMLIWGALALGGAVAAIGAFQRARFVGEGAGWGRVLLDESLLGYLGPEGSSFIDIDDITRVDFAPAQRGAGHWVLRGKSGVQLRIPARVEGGEQLFDALAQLPGLSVPKLLAAPDTASRVPIAVWQKPRPQIERLH
ncbi:hypothetical protein [Oceanomicrobium pacificus]|uniref:Uncharacterized protein n=1 Tax=Oceanomicrobium pacificus TaxID=2692916 RepID=A0A6B0TZW0_9RHOB|nr:hypothetical protein [Oceanomicrobium pacificus]MXU66792.1 hypothetical protein [Oceanomicrobium pacificus]